MGSGGGTSDGPQNPQAIAQRMAPKREEQRLRRASFVSGDQSYVRGGGDIVRDSSGRGVLTGVGVQRAEASRQQDLETLISLRTGGEGDLGNIALSCNYTQKQQHIHISQSLTQPRTHQIRVLDT